MKKLILQGPGKTSIGCYGTVNEENRSYHLY